MTSWTELYPGDPVLIQRVWKKDPGHYTVQVPQPASWDGVSPVYLRAIARGCGGQGANWGGGGAYARSKVPVKPNDTLLLQVGSLATADIPGDSWVKRSDGAVICYADRGRGNGNGGMGASCTGDVVGSGNPGGGTAQKGGASASDAAIFAGLDAGNFGYDNTGAGFLRAADFGGGGHGLSNFNEVGAWMQFAAYGAGSGVVVLEFFASDPLY